MSADFTPEKEDLKILTPFKMQVLTNFPYIEADFDALTDYQLLCKVVEYLNNVIAETNEVTEQTLSLYNAFVALQNYVNNYFDNLDLTEEVSNKLDEMARDGTITNLIQAYIDPIFAEYTETVNSIIASQNENIETFRTDQVNFESSINSTVEEIREEVAAATSGSPKGVYATVDALTTADPDHDYIYLVLADGKWYYYSTGDTSWVAGGVYQASSIGDEVIDINNLVESLQTNLHQEIPTLSWTSGYYIRYDNGGVYTAGPYRLSSKIHLNKGDILTFTGSIANADIIAALSSYEYGNITNLSATNKFKPLLTFSDTSSHTVIYTATYEADYYINTLGEATNVKVYRNVYYQDNLDINDNIAFINNIIKNDSEDFTQGYYDTGNGGSNTSTQFYISDYIRIDELRDITLKTNNFKLSINVNDVGMSFFDREKNFISGVKYMPTAETNIVTTKTPKGAYYVRMTGDILMFTGGYALYYSNFKNYVKDSSINGSFRNVLSCYSNITCFGDSLTYSQVYKSNSDSRQAYITYPMHLARICGNNVDAYAKAGDTSKQCWDRYNNVITSKTNQLTIIYLGTNSGLTDTIDTDCAGNDYTTYNGESNTGCYGKLIKKSLDAGSKVLLVKCYATSNNTTETTNEVIDKFCTKFNIACVDNDRIADTIYHLGNENYTNTNHYNDLGYEAFTKQLIYNVSNLDNTMLKRILP